MAEFLIRRVDAPTTMPGSYQRGDIVAVYADGRCTEPPAATSPFWIIKVPGVTVAQVEQYVQARVEGFVITPFVPVAHLGNPHELQPNVVSRRLFTVDLDALSPSIRAELEATGMAEVTNTALLQRLRNKVTGQTER